MKLHVLARIAVTSVLGLAMLAGTTVAHADSDTSPVQQSVTPQRSQQIAPAAVNPNALVSIHSTLGGGRSLPFAQVEIRSTDGKKVTSARANARGYAFVKRSILPATFVVSVIGGKAWKQAGRPTLKATASVPENKNRVVFVSPVTGIASVVAAQRKTSYAKALRRTTRALHIQSWMKPWQYSTVAPAFSALQLMKWSKQHGDLGDGVKVLTKRIVNGQKVPNFSPLSKASRHPAKTRSTVSWVGETVMEGILEGSASSGTEAAVGDMFGMSNPTAAELSDIESELVTISTQLTALQNSMNQLIAIMEQAELTELVSSLNTIMGNTEEEWSNYKSALTIDPNTVGYSATMSNYAYQFYGDISPYIGQFGGLFNSSTTNGVLAQLYANNDAPWWMSSDVENIQSTIDYFGTYQAMATALLNEAWWKNGGQELIPPTPLFINNENTATYSPQNADIYLSMPTSIDSSSIVVPSQQMAYRLFGGTTSYVQQKMNLVDGKGNCSNMGSPTTYGMWPMMLPSTTTWTETWGAMITNSSFSLSSSSAYSALSPKRTVTSTSGEVTTYESLETLATGAPGAWVMVSAQSQPIASYYTFEDDSPVFWSWLWCGGTSVSLDSTSSSTWLTAFDTDADGDNIPGDQGGLIYAPVPVGVLAQQPGSYAYVQPTG